MGQKEEETGQARVTALLIWCSLRPSTCNIIFISMTSAPGWVVLFPSLLSGDCLVKSKEE